LDSRHDSGPRSPVSSAELPINRSHSPSSATDRASPRLFGFNGLLTILEPPMSNRTNRRSMPKNDCLHESIAIFLKMQKATTEGEFQQLLVDHDRLTDADGKPRLFARTLEEFRRGPAVKP
jgi:hypothetical protein